MIEAMIKTGFKDHFSQGAGDYSRYRPRYPDELFAYLASLCARKDLAWDCGCGSGQATLGLVPHFQAIEASDASAQQIAKAPSHPKIAYRSAAAEASGLAARSLDLILAAQAAHWFDLEAFYAEARRAAKPGCIIALVSYHRMRTSKDIDRITEDLHRETLGAFWPPERAHVDAAYRTLAFPFQELDPPEFFITAEWGLNEVLGYLGTWSAVKKYRQATGEDPLEPAAKALREVWGDPAQARAITWPIHMCLGRVSGD